MEFRTRRTRNKTCTPLEDYTKNMCYHMDKNLGVCGRFEPKARVRSIDILGIIGVHIDRSVGFTAR